MKYFFLLAVLLTPLTGYTENQMDQVTTKRPEIKLVGISIRTSYTQEVNKMTGKILPCIMQYFHGTLYEQIPNRTKPGTTFCVYTDYESDYTGAYTYFVGEEVSSLDSVPAGLSTLVIPSQTYAKFTTKPNPMPDVIINAWEAIWKMSENTLGGKRNYHSDFEVYDERASDHQNIVLDLYVGVTP